ncbi:MAG TPA: UvrD-helicase domain-containing protein [Candidatus Paceibacterota bacterium]|nr:UvrD-helicase domain-containing protein [Candidatus Paceibacterota bacterium]
MKFNLNPQQKLAVQADDKPLLIVAGAGTGKTSTLTGRLAYLIEKGVPADKILALTFTNKAAKEMSERVANSEWQITNGDKPSTIIRKPFIGTFHSLGARILRVEAKLAGRDHNFAIFDTSDSMQIIRKLLKTEFSKDKEKEYMGAGEISHEISRLKNGVVSRGEILKSPEDGELVIKIFHRYEKELQKNNAFDFDDLIEKVTDIFKKHPEVLKKYQKRFHHILIDEYQDLNNKQYELVKLLVGDSPRISVVGDDQQMIYSFRGSNFSIFMDFEKDWPEANVVLLEENYRSSSNIIKAASSLISNNVNQKPKTLWTKKENGAFIRITETADEEDEAYWMAGQIESRIMNNELRTLTEGKAKNKNSIIHNSQFIIPSIAVIYRTNAQSRAIEQELIEKGISYRIYGGLRFYERKEIKDIVAALRYAQNPKDEVSKERLEKNIAKGRFSKFRETLYGDESSASPAELIHSFLDSTEYLDIVGRNFLNADERRENIAELLHFASEFTDLPSFLEQIALLQPMDNMANDKEPSAISHTPYAVNLMTIHLSKGLEFDYVFIAGCNEGLLPHSRSVSSQNETEEERRLMYVAMTRAKKELSISFYDIPSRFIGEIPQELVEFESLVSGNNNISDLDDEERYITLD